MKNSRKKPNNELSVFRKRGLGLPLTEDEKKFYAEYQSDYFKKKYGTPKGRAKALLKSAKRASEKNGLDFDLTEDWIENKLVNGRCEVSGIEFDFSSLNTGKTGHGSQNPFCPSLDKTNCNLGYTKDNVKVVVWIYNVGKQNNTHDDMLKLARGLIDMESK